MGNKGLPFRLYLPYMIIDMRAEKYCKGFMVVGEFLGEEGKAGYA